MRPNNLPTAPRFTDNLALDIDRPASGPALIVFAKVPAPGAVKTRLVPPLTPEQAASLYDAFLHDALDEVSASEAFRLDDPVAVRLYLAGEGELTEIPESVIVCRQQGDGLGARMANAFAQTFAAGHDRAVIMGTDHPTLPTDFIAEAFRALRDPLTAVIGPSEDGGYTLLGLNELRREIFEMAYSHDGVFLDTLSTLISSHLNPVVLPAHYDVDTPPTLRRLVDEWRGGAPVGRRTVQALTQLTAADGPLA